MTPLEITAHTDAEYLPVTLGWNPCEAAVVVLDFPGARWVVDRELLWWGTFASARAPAGVEGGDVRAWTVANRHGLPMLCVWLRDAESGCAATYALPPAVRDWLRDTYERVDWHAAYQQLSRWADVQAALLSGGAP